MPEANSKVHRARPVLCGLEEFGRLLRARHPGVGHSSGSLILQEAGGKVKYYRGGILDLEGREIVASNGRLYSAMTKMMGEDDQQSV